MISRMTSVSLKTIGRVAIAVSTLARSAELDQVEFGRRSDCRIHCAGMRFRLFRSAGQDNRTWAIFRKPAIGGVAHDRQQPCAGVFNCGAAQCLECAHASVLDNVLGVCRAASEPARQRIGVIEVRQHLFRKASSRSFARHIPPPAALGCNGDPALHARMQPAKIDDLAWLVEANCKALIRIDRLGAEFNGIADN